MNAIDKYISGFPENTQKQLKKIRFAIQKAAPNASETIKYGIPTFTLNGNLVHFAAYKNHIGFYPAPSGILAFKKELSVYKGAKGSIQFPLDRPLPLSLVSKIVKYRTKENLKKFENKKNLKICSQGHKYFKSSDCPTCPVCEDARRPLIGFLSILAAPARRALENKGIETLKQLSKYSEAEILNLHGMGKTSIPILRKLLKDSGLLFKEK